MHVRPTPALPLRSLPFSSCAFPPSPTLTLPTPPCPVSTPQHHATPHHTTQHNTQHAILTTHDSPSTHYSRFTIHEWRIATYYSLLTTYCCLLLTTRYSLPTLPLTTSVYCSLLTTHNLLLTTYWYLPFPRFRSIMLALFKSIPKELPSLQTVTDQESVQALTIPQYFSTSLLLYFSTSQLLYFSTTPQTKSPCMPLPFTALFCLLTSSQLPCY